jgi:hypothetical protein
MGADAGAGPVGALLFIDPRLAVFDDAAEEFVGEVGVGAAVPAALFEGQVDVLVAVIDALGRVTADAIGKQVGEIGDLDALGGFAAMEDRRLVLDLRPLEARLVAVNVERFAVLT